MERQFKPGHEDQPTHLTISTILGIAHIAITSQTADKTMCELRLEIEGPDGVEVSHNYYMSRPPQHQLEDTLVYREACEALGIEIEE